MNSQIAVVQGQFTSNEGPDLSFLVTGLTGNQLGNCQMIVLANALRHLPEEYILEGTNRMYSADKKTRFASAFAVLDRNGKIFVVNRDVAKQEVLNDGLDLLHAAATVMPGSIFYKLGVINNECYTALLCSKISSVEFAAFAVEEIQGSEETQCIMPVWVLRIADFDGTGIPGFYEPKELEGIKVTAKLAAALEYLQKK